MRGGVELLILAIMVLFAFAPLIFIDLEAWGCEILRNEQVHKDESNQHSNDINDR
mgnify:CR=1 FL=1